MNILEKIEDSYLFGCVKYKNGYSFYLMPIAYWILNYAKYDPKYNPDDWQDVFRDNILNVTDTKIDSFIQSIEIDEIDITRTDIFKYNLLDIFLFFIDFDSKLFISYFDEIDVEEYLPNDTWIGKFDKPLDYIPNELISKLK